MKNSNWIVGILIALGLCTTTVSAGQLQVSRTDQGVTLENTFLKVQIVEQGGKINLFLDKTTGHQYATVGSDMSGLDKLRIYEELLNKEFLESRYTLEVHEDGGNSAVVRCRYLARSPRFKTKGFELIKTYTLGKEDCGLKIQYILMANEGIHKFSPFIHNVFKLPGADCYAYCQTKDGLFCKDTTPKGPADHFVTNLSESWAAIISHAASRGLVAVVDDYNISEIFFWLGNEQHATLEPLYKPVSFAADSIWKSTEWLFPVNGLNSCHLATNLYAAGFTKHDGKSMLMFYPTGSLGPTHITITNGTQKLAEQSFDAKVGQCVSLPVAVGDSIETLQVTVQCAQSTRTHTIRAACVPVQGQVTARHTIYPDGTSQNEQANAVATTDQPVTYVSPDIPVFSRFRIANKLPATANVSLVLEVPQGITFMNPLGRYSTVMNPSLLHMEKITVNGEPINRYILNKVESSATLFSISTWPHGQTGNITYYLKWNDGQQPAQTLKVVSVHIPSAPQPKRLIANLGWMPGHIHDKWPHFYDNMVYLGVNTVGCQATESEQLPQLKKRVDEARKHGLYFAANYSPFMNWGSGAKDKKDDPGCLAVSINGTESKKMYVCPSSRGSVFEKDTDRAASFGKLGIPMLWLDCENWGDAAYCFCPRCVEGFKQFLAQKYPDLPFMDPHDFEKEAEKYFQYNKAWKAFHILLGNEIYGTIAKKFKKNLENCPDKPLGPYQIGTYGALPGTKYSLVLNVDSLIHNNILTVVQPSLYVAGDANLVAEKIQKIRTFTQNSNITSWLSAGYNISSECRPEEFRYCLLENYLNGAGGFTSFTWEGFDGMDLRELAIGMRMVVPVEDIIMDGSVLDGLKTSNDKVKICGLGTKGEKLILLSEYYGTKKTLVSFEIEVSQDCDVTNMRTGDVIAHLKAGQQSVSTVLPANDRAMLLYVGNRHFQSSSASTQANDISTAEPAKSTAHLPVIETEKCERKVVLTQFTDGTYAVATNDYKLYIDRNYRVDKIQFIHSGNTISNRYLTSNFVQSPTHKQENLLQRGDQLEILRGPNNAWITFHVKSQKKSNTYDFSIAYDMTFYADKPLMRVLAHVTQQGTPVNCFVRINQWSPANWDTKAGQATPVFPNWSCGEPFRSGSFSEYKKTSIKPTQWREGYRWIAAYNDKDAFGVICFDKQSPTIYVDENHKFYMNGMMGMWSVPDLKVDQYVYIGPATEQGKVVGQWAVKLMEQQE